MEGAVPRGLSPHARGVARSVVGRAEVRCDSVDDVDLPFRTLRPWLLETFGRPVHRVALDAGSTCPNRDGTKGFGGCVYCDVEGSGTGALRSGLDLERQLSDGLARVARRGDGAGAVAYFQSYSNTYVAPERLREVLAVVEPRLAVHGGPVVAVSVATRPDTLSEESLAILADLARRVPVWLELGLEAADDAILSAIRRFHTVAEFLDAAERAKAAGLLVVGHAILGLPGDGREGARRTASVLARSAASAVKVHNLMVLRRTQLEKAWRAGEVEVLDLATYVEWLADFAERLRDDQVLHRLTGDASQEDLLAPTPNFDKNEVRAKLATVLRARRGAGSAGNAGISPAGTGSGRSSDTARARSRAGRGRPG
jgi:radical SAM protein (TIGR01212 family)